MPRSSAQRSNEAATGLLGGGSWTSQVCMPGKHRRTNVRPPVVSAGQSPQPSQSVSFDQAPAFKLHDPRHSRSTRSQDQLSIRSHPSLAQTSNGNDSSTARPITCTLLPDRVLLLTHSYCSSAYTAHQDPIHQHSGIYDASRLLWVWVRCWVGAGRDAVAGGPAPWPSGPGSPASLKMRRCSGCSQVRTRSPARSGWRHCGGLIPAPGWTPGRCRRRCGSWQPRGGLRSASWRQLSGCGTSWSALPVAGSSQ
jgi:hypothetical protein